ncbi:MAG: hypothetical protein AAGA53_06805 [Pseudomonadota bacterium]
MSLEKIQVETRPELDFTASSTLVHLIAVGVTCVSLWVVIALTINT